MKRETKYTWLRSQSSLRLHRAEQDKLAPQINKASMCISNILNISITIRIFIWDGAGLSHVAKQSPNLYFF